MARNAPLVVAFAAALAGTAQAQALQRLHVRSMVAAADPQRVKLGDMLRLVARIHVDEHIARLDNVTLPDLSGFDVLGDERRCVPARRGTDCTETLSLAPSAAGIHAIGPVTLDAVDARTGRPTRFGSNAVRVTVIEAPLGGPARTLGSAAAAWRLWTGIALLALAGFAIVVGFRRRKQPAAERLAPASLVPVRASRDDDARWRTVIEHLRARPSRARVDVVRTILRERVGARAGETFADLAARGVQLEEPSAMEALRLIERAAFVDEVHLAAAVCDALPALESIAGMKRVSG